MVDSEDHDVHDIEQPMYQVSAAQHLNRNDVEEGSFSHVSQNFLGFIPIPNSFSY